MLQIKALLFLQELVVKHFAGIPLGKEVSLRKKEVSYLILLFYFTLLFPLFYTFNSTSDSLFIQSTNIF